VAKLVVRSVWGYKESRKTSLSTESNSCQERERLRV